MTAMVNEVKTPHRFLKELLFSDSDPRPTETLEIGVLIGDRVVAPFVRRGAEAIEVTPFTEKIYNVTAPNIRIKRHLEASELMFQRRVGHVIHVESNDILDAAQEHVARSSLRLAQLVEEAEEYLCAQAIRGAISYSVPGEENFSITFPRSSSHNITLVTFWDQAMSDPEGDCRTAMQLVANDVGLSVTDVILGSEATSAFLKNAQVSGDGGLLDNRRILAGELDLQQRVQQSGSIFLGMFRGLRFWSYTRQTQVPSAAGMKTLASFDLVRPKYAEFVTADPAAENVMYYGAIPDLKALQGRLFQGRRFSKSWEQEDPSVMWQLLASRPLPCTRRPDSMVSMKVVSG
jgi:hypothetical protein